MKKKMMNFKIIDLNKLLNYYESLRNVMDKIYPEELTYDNINNYNFDLNIKHPKWVKRHFPLMLIYHRKKAGKLRSSRSLSIMYQNNFNVLTQLVWTADDFGLYYRKNKHKGFSNIVGAIKGTENDFIGLYADKQKPKKYKNFIEFLNLYDPTNIHVKALCEILDKNFACDSTGQLRLI